LACMNLLFVKYNGTNGVLRRCPECHQSNSKVKQEEAWNDGGDCALI